MINGNPNEFIATIYTCQDIVFVYDNVKYWFQGYIVAGEVHMEVFQNTPFFNGKTFWEAEKDIEWVDC